MQKNSNDFQKKKWLSLEKRVLWTVSFNYSLCIWYQKLVYVLLDSFALFKLNKNVRIFTDQQKKAKFQRRLSWKKKKTLLEKKTLKIFLKWYKFNTPRKIMFTNIFTTIIAQQHCYFYSVLFWKDFSCNTSN